MSGTAGAGARGGITIGEGDFRGGAWLAGEIGVGGTLGQAWVFDDPAEAAGFIRERRNQAIREQLGRAAPTLGAIDGVIRAVRGPRFPSPDIEYFEAGPQGSAGAGAGYGPGRVEGGVDGSAVVGGKRDHRTGETTLYIELAGERSWGGGVVLGTTNTKGWTGVGELVLDADGQPTTLRITDTVQTERGGVLAGDYLSLDDLGERIGSADVDLDSAGTHAVSIVLGRHLLAVLPSTVIPDGLGVALMAVAHKGMAATDQDAFVGSISALHHELVQWRLLLQIDSDHTLDDSWGDVTLFWVASREQIAARAWSQMWFDYQLS